jgi:hypothetical protein
VSHLQPSSGWDHHPTAAADSGAGVVSWAIGASPVTRSAYRDTEALGGRTPGAPPKLGGALVTMTIHASQRHAYLESQRHARALLVEALQAASHPVDRVVLQRAVAERHNLPTSAVRAALWELIADRDVFITSNEGLISAS